MADSPAYVTPPPGYVSAGGKRVYTVAVIILAALSLPAMTVLPLAVLVPLQLSTMIDFQLPQVIWVDDAVLWQGKLWMVRETVPLPGDAEMPFSPSGPHTRTLVSWDPAKGGKVVEEAALEVVKGAARDTDCPVPLADGNRLWLISRRQVVRYEAGGSHAAPIAAQLANPTRPFLYQGRPAVIDYLPKGPVLRTLADGGWTDVGPVNLRLPQEPHGWPPFKPYDVRVLADGGVAHVLVMVDENIYYRQGLGLPDERLDPWREVAGAGFTLGHFAPWAAAIVEGRPVVLVPPEIFDSDATLVGLRLEGKGPRPEEEDLHMENEGWQRFFRCRAGDRARPGFSTGHAMMVAEGNMMTRVGIYPAPGNGFAAITSKPFYGTMVFRATDSPMERRLIDIGSTVPTKYLCLMLLAGLLPMLLPLVIAAVVSILASWCRLRVVGAGGVTVAYAPLWRRSVAATIDYLIGMAPQAAVYVWLLAHITDITYLTQESDELFEGRFMAIMLLMAAGWVWSLAAYLLFSYTQGRWGATPGKWLLGIRVRGADLRPCGFGRALLRNLLWIVDVSFGGLVALVVAALTSRFQRVGDLVAKTVVVNTRTLPPQQQR